uniref:Uncharacterized protein n=1 Tax=Arundo donax TaxID=35708 RepID=A0A0A9FHP1_ARUDO
MQPRRPSSAAPTQSWRRARAAAVPPTPSWPPSIVRWRRSSPARKAPP